MIQQMHLNKYTRMTEENKHTESQEENKKPNDQSGVMMQGHIKIFDPETGERSLVDEPYISSYREGSILSGNIPGEDETGIPRTDEGGFNGIHANVNGNGKRYGSKS